MVMLIASLWLVTGGYKSGGKHMCAAKDTCLRHVLGQAMTDVSSSLHAMVIVLMLKVWRRPLEIQLQCANSTYFHLKEPLSLAYSA